MDWRLIWHPRTLLALGALGLTAALVACGGATAPEQPGDTGGGAAAAPAPAATPTLDPFAGVQEPTPTARLDATATPVPVPTAVAVDARPSWWQIGESKHYRGRFPAGCYPQPRVLGCALRRFPE